ncbi:MAG: hypothetical protein J6T18_01145 [Bacteroidaceae bacterium]|nr:hypothetical protein [Bacteroidaceae bacterium]MBP5646575.1 hypothetical protein [Bacteroidaceae bacterium]
MKEFDLEGLSREMPYKMPEHFLDDLTERVVSKISVEQQKRHKKERRIYVLFASAASAAAVALLLIHPFKVGGPNIPDYESISQCASIDEVFQSMSTDELGVYSMMSNYYGN